MILDIYQELSKMNIEQGLITKILESKDMALVKDKQIKAHYLSREYRPAFKFIDDFYFKNGTVPTVRVFSKEFPNIELEKTISAERGGEHVVGTEEPLAFWCDKIREKATHNKLCDNLEKMAEMLNESQTDQAYSLLKKTVLHIEDQFVETSAINVVDDGKERKLAYEQRKETKGMLGISTGIDKLDYIIKGLQPKQLITLIARTGLGKTWTLVKVAAHAQLNGYKVLFLTTEMSEEQIEDRLEAMLIGILYGNFNYNKFKSGSLDREQEEIYYEFLERKAKFEPLIIDSATGVSNVNAKIDQHQPDLVLVDSAYLMEDDRGSDQDWLRVAHITRDLKSLAKTKKIPIFINSQADSNTSIKTGPELTNIGFSKAIGQDSDVVLALSQDEDMRESREMDIKVLKQREGILGKVTLNWDFSTMNFDSVYSTVEGGNEDYSQQQGVIGIN